VFDRVFGLQQSGQHADTPGTRGWWTLVGVTGACVLATLLNPYGVNLYSAVFEMPTQAGAFKLIAELQPPTFRYVGDWALLALLGLAAFTLGSRVRYSAFEFLLLISSAFFAFRAQRDLWLLVLAALAILASSHNIPSTALANTFALTRWRTGAVAMGVLAVFAIGRWTGNLSERHLQDEVAAKFPVEAAAVVEQQAYAGPLYNDYGWGGYLIWRLPWMPVAIDGRANLHGDARMEQSMSTWKGLPGWESDAELAKAGVVIASAKSPLTSLLRLDQRFRLVHEDPVGVVFVARKGISD
jgi:hypothetical protein